MRASTALILTCCLVSLIAWSVDEIKVQENMVYSFQNIMQGRLWVLVVAIFVHSDIFHLAINMLFLFVFGRTLEEELDGKRMVESFLIGGILSFLLTTPFYRLDTTMGGASAAIFTLAAIAMLVKPLKFSLIFLSPVGLVAIAFFLYNAIIIYYGVQSTISYIGHVIGFILGIPFGIAWSKSWRRNLFLTILLLAIYYTVFKLILKILAPS